MKLSDHFTVAEAVFTRHHRILNRPTAPEIDVMKKAAIGLERVRALLGNKPISISSWFRSAALNKAVGSSPRSQHRKGEAIDFNCYAYGSELEICQLIARNKDLIRFDQLILENGWIHISFAVVSRTEPRKQVLTITPDGVAHPGLVYYK